MPSIALCTSTGGGASATSPWRWRMRARVVSSLELGSCTALIPRSTQTMPQRPIAVSNIAKWWPVMARLQILLPEILNLMRGLNLGLEIVAIHPNSGEFCAVPRKELGRAEDFPLSARRPGAAWETPRPGVSLPFEQNYGLRPRNARRNS